MDSAERDQLLQTLRGRCTVIADDWYQAVASTGAALLDTAEVRQRLVELTGQAIELLLTEPFDQSRARAIGAALAGLRPTRSEVLGRTQSVLGEQLVEGLSAEQAAALRSRLVALLGGLAAGFCDQTCEIILAEQGQSRRTLIADLKRAEEELKEHRSRLEELVEERTAELILAVEHLEREITDRRRAEDALRRRNRELALLNRAAQVLNSTLDLDKVLVTVLEEVRRLLGVVASSVWLIDPETGELVCRNATGSQSDVVRGWRLAPGDGIVGRVASSSKSLIVSDAWAEDSHFEEVDRETGLALRSILTVPLRVKRRVIGALQVVDTEVDRFSDADLTLLEPLASSAAIAVDNARLVEALRHHTTQLQARNEELDAFAHTVAHDLKNPLALVIGLAEALGDMYATLSDEERRRYLHQIAMTGRKMDNIVSELLLLAGVRQTEVEIGPLDMEGIVTEAWRRLAHMVEDRQAEVIVPERWPVALGYGPWVEEVWVNYLSNALKYGGCPPHVELGFESSADRRAGAAADQWDSGDALVRFWVRDNGPGLTGEEQERLFTPFTRFDQVSTKGHGLGLSIVRRIVEKLGGQVGVESELGQGSLFTFTLPTALQTSIDEESVGFSGRL
jgi:signal transduction histidine kinase